MLFHFIYAAFQVEAGGNITRHMKRYQKEENSNLDVFLFHTGNTKYSLFGVNLDNFQGQD